MNKVIIKKGAHKGERAIIVNIKNNIVTLRLDSLQKDITLSEDDIEPI